MIERITRRRMIASLGAGGLMLSGCDRITRSSGFQAVQSSAQELTRSMQRLAVDRDAPAREYGAADMSPVFRTNGNVMPASADYRAHLESGFADWRLIVDGLVARPLSLSLDRIRRLPARTQITRHDCVEGWSAIGKWHGPPLRLILNAAGLRDSCRFIIFHCADDYGPMTYYESIDLIDAFHPQTILAWAMNDRLLPVENGAPLRLRVERQLGYKHAKYVRRIEAVHSLASVQGGKGGYWEDHSDYEWYAGI